MLNIRHQMFNTNYQIFIPNYFLSEIFGNWNFSKVQFSVKYPISFSFSYSIDEEKRQKVQRRPYGKCWIDVCRNDLLHKALSFQKMSIQNVSATNFLDYSELNTIEQQRLLAYNSLKCMSISKWETQYVL